MTYKTSNFFMINLFHSFLESKEVEVEELEKLKKQWKEPKGACWYYCGNDRSFDYIVFVDFDLINNKKNMFKYKIKKGYIKLLKPFTHSNNKKKWKVLPWGPKKHMRGVKNI